MTEYYNTQTRERRYSYNKPDGHDWIRWDMFNQNSNDRANDDDEGDSGLINTAVAAVEVGAVLTGLFDPGSGDGGSDFSGGGGDFGGGGASGDF